MLEDGLYALTCRVAVGTLATPFVIDFNPFLSGDLFYELYSYPVFVGQQAVDSRLAGYAAAVLRAKAQATFVPMIYHNAGASRTIVEGTFFDMVHFPVAILSTSDLSWP